MKNSFKSSASLSISGGPLALFSFAFFFYLYINVYRIIDDQKELSRSHFLGLIHQDLLLLLCCLFINRASEPPSFPLSSWQSCIFVVDGFSQ
jgi:hypothetical protein